jgi:hypothetical protein
MGVFLFKDDLRQHRSGDVGAGLCVVDEKILAPLHHCPEIIERHKGVSAGIIEAQHSFQAQGPNFTDFAAGFRCLIPAAPAVPAAADKQQNDKYDDEKRGVIHVELLLAVPCVFSHFAYALPLQPTLLIPIRSYLRRHDTPNRHNQRLYPDGPVVRSILTLICMGVIPNLPRLEPIPDGAFHWWPILNLRVA